MSNQGTKITILLCILDSNMQMLLRRVESSPTSLQWEFVGMDWSDNDSPLAVISNYLAEKYSLQLAPDTCNPWLFRVYRYAPTAIALLYSCALAPPQTEVSSSLVWFAPQDVGKLPIHEPDSLFLPYILPVLSSYKHPATTSQPLL